jgi:hypothetical protein
MRWLERYIAGRTATLRYFAKLVRILECRRLDE